MEPWFDRNEINAITVYMKSGGWLTEYKQTRKFEDLIADYTGAKHCIVVNNGTVSLSLALLACGIESGDEVIVPDFTMIATPNSAKFIGATPIFVDIESESLCLDHSKTEQAINDKTKAIIYVSFNGRSGSIDKFRDLCNKHNIVLIEDSAQSLGSHKNKQHLGTFGDIGSFSFSVPKIITTGQGGALITANDKLSDKLRKLKDFGRIGGGNDIHNSIGYNSKFTDLQAVIGIEQLKKLDQRVKRKKEIYKFYEENLENVDEVQMIPTNLNETTPWFIDVFIPDPVNLQKYLKERNIGSREIYPPIHAQKAYSKLNNLSFPVTEYYCKRGLWLPSSSKLVNEEIEYICKTIKEYYG